MLNRRRPFPTTLLEAALLCRDCGLSLLPISADGSKAPDFISFPVVRDENTGQRRRPWGHLNQRLPTDDELRHWFRTKRRDQVGLAIIAGPISGELEVIDADNKEVAKQFEAQLKSRSPKLFQKLVIVESPRGRHYYYRCRRSGGNRKLAMAWDDASGRPKTLIDLKGRGGFVIAPPSPAACHPLKLPYTWATARDFRDLVEVTDAERAFLHDRAHSCATGIPPAPPPRPRPVLRIMGQRQVGPIQNFHRPGDEFNATEDWANILEPHGWICTGDNGAVRNWRRPGKGSGSSATTGLGERDLLYVFSTNAAPFDSERSYTKFHAFALLNHHGDFRAAAAELARRGYGGMPLRSLDQRRRLTATDIGFVPRSIPRLGIGR